jgi:uncharacterized protein YgiM (DUF1202 family)
MQRNMRALLLIVAAAGLMGGAAVVDTLGEEGLARASDRVEAKKAADIFATPGEQARVVTRVRAGKEMVVLETKNRWYKVRVNGRTGWITRTNVRSVEVRETAPRAKRRRPFVEGRSTRRGFRGKAPKDRIGADATESEFVEDDVDRDERSRRERKRAAAKRRKAQEREAGGSFIEEEEEDEELDDERDLGDEDEEDELLDEDAEEDEPKPRKRDAVVVKVARLKIHEERSTRSEAVDRVKKGTRLYVVEREGSWIMVESDDGETGWVKASKVEDASSGGYQREKFAKRAAVGLGFATLAQTFTSDGTDPRSRYTITSGAAVLSLGGEATYDWKPKYLLGGDISYRLHYASPGIRYEYMDQTANIGFKSHQIDIGARGGYKLSDASGMAAFARLGYHYERFGINNVSDFDRNLAYLPTEILQGLTIGAILDMPIVTRKIENLGARASFDAMPMLASRQQTVGLQDGASSEAFAMWLNLGAQYAWKDNLQFSGNYQYTYAKTSWTGDVDGSMRPHLTDSTGAERKDGTHMFLLGVGRPF